MSFVTFNLPKYNRNGEDYLKFFKKMVDDVYRVSRNVNLNIIIDESTGNVFTVPNIKKNDALNIALFTIENSLRN